MISDNERGYHPNNDDIALLKIKCIGTKKQQFIELGATNMQFKNEIGQPLKAAGLGDMQGSLFEFYNRMDFYIGNSFFLTYLNVFR